VFGFWVSSKKLPIFLMIQGGKLGALPVPTKVGSGAKWPIFQRSSIEKGMIFCWKPKSEHSLITCQAKISNLKHLIASQFHFGEHEMSRNPVYSYLASPFGADPLPKGQTRKLLAWKN
jgi:hypothetical protein